MFESSKKMRDSEYGTQLEETGFKQLVPCNL